jgi:hypothetical protein
MGKFTLRKYLWVESLLTIVIFLCGACGANVKGQKIMIRLLKYVSLYDLIGLFFCNHALELSFLCKFYVMQHLQ